jgi:hypothetical protein
VKTLTPRQAGPFITSLVNEASEGEILIVRNGEPVARLEREGAHSSTVREQFCELRRKRAGNRIDGETIRRWREEGRR